MSYVAYRNWLARFLLFCLPWILGILTYVYPTSLWFDPLNAPREHVTNEPDVNAPHYLYSNPDLPFLFSYPKTWRVTDNKAHQPKSSQTTLYLHVIKVPRLVEDFHALFAKASPASVEEVQGHGFTSSILWSDPLNANVLVERARALPVFLEYHGASPKDRADLELILRSLHPR